MGADELIKCPFCSHDQAATTYCARCRVHIKHYGDLKQFLTQLEAGLGQVRKLLQGAQDPKQAADTLRGFAEAYQGLRTGCEKLSRSQREMATLAEVGRMINSVLTMDKLLDLIMDMAIQVMNAERGFLMLKDNETGTLTAQVARNMDATEQDKSQLAISSNISSRVASEGKPVLATDAQNEGQFQGMQSIMDNRIRSLLCVPLKLKSGEIIGVIYVDNRVTAGAFTDDSVEFLSGFANQAAIAIENARLYEGIEKETKSRMSLQRYLSPHVVEDVLSKKESLSLGGKKVEASVIFLDICGFTPFSQKLPPEEVLDRLNGFFSIMTDIIFTNHGTVLWFLGDAIMAVFGAPMPSPNHARNAVTAALGIMDATKKLQEEATREGRHAFQIRIGVNTGEMVAGNIGAPNNMNYAVIGDQVNLASRIQTNAAPGEILINETTYLQAKDAVLVKHRTPIEVKGRTGTVNVCEVLGLDPAAQAKAEPKNNRSSDRKETSIFAIYRDPVTSRVKQGVVKNISAGGMQLSTKEPLDQGTELTLSFNLPGGQKVDQIRGKVANAQQLVDDRGAPYFKVGVQFTHCPDADREKIARLLTPS